ncbi:hypothetical protein D9M71_308140 [compost metagenome]
MTFGLQLFAQFGQWRQVAGSQLHHPLHQVDAPDLFGDTVFDLQARIHFQEIEALGIAVEHEFNGAGAAVTDRLGQLDRSFAQGFGHAVGQVWRRGFLQHFLVTSLHRAIAYAQGQHFALAIAEHLDFQVPSTLDVFFDEHAGIAEVVLPQAFNRFERFAQFLGIAAHAHADTTAPGRALEHDRVADLFGQGQGDVEVFQQLSAFEHGHAVLFGQGAGGVLEAEQAQLFGRRADEGDAGIFAGFGKSGVLRQEAITGVNRLRTTGLGHAEDLVHGQISVGCSAVTQAMGLVGFKNVPAGGIGFAVDGNALDVQRAQGTQDAAGNGAAVGNQQGIEHGSTPGGGQLPWPRLGCGPSRSL